MPSYPNDIYGMLNKIADATGAPDTYPHDQYGQIRRIADVVGAVGTYPNDRLGQLKRIADGIGVAGSYPNDIYGQVKKIADAGASGPYPNDIYGQLARIATNGIGPTIILSSATIADSASIGDTVGTLSVNGGTGSYTFTLTSNPGSLFSITGTALKVAASLTAGSDAITVRADNGAGGVVTQPFLITVTSSGFTPSLDFSDGRNSQYLILGVI